MFTNEYQPETVGYQVLLSVYNQEYYLERCLKSLDNTLSGKKWILLYGDDESTDESVMELARYARNITADKVHLYDFNKANTVGQAKNRLVKECHKFKKDYPYVLFMDGDDEMLPERPKLIESLDDKEYVVGAFNRRKTNNQNVVVNSSTASRKLAFGPWATLFKCDFLPEEEPFFPEDEVSNTGFEDILTWYHLKYIKNIIPATHNGNAVHNYIERKGSTSRQENVNYQRNIFWGISELIKNEKRNIYENPLSREEAEDAMRDYIALKEDQPAPSPLD